MVYQHQAQLASDCFHLLIMVDTSVSSVPRENRELEDRVCRSSDQKPPDIYLGW